MVWIAKMNGQDGHDSSWATELLAAAQVIDLARDPDAPERSLVSRPEGAGLLIPVGPDHQAIFRALWGQYEAAIIRHRGDYATDERLTGKMKKIIRAASRKNPPPPELEYLSVEPEDYTVREPHFADPPFYGLSIHTRPDHCHFVAWMPTEPGFSWSCAPGRLRVYRPKVVRNTRTYPFHLRAHRHTLKGKKLQQDFRTRLYEFMHPPAEVGAAEEVQQ